MSESTLDEEGANRTPEPYRLWASLPRAARQGSQQEHVDSPVNSNGKLIRTGRNRNRSGIPAAPQACMRFVSYWVRRLAASADLRLTADDFEDLVGEVLVKLARRPGDQVKLVVRSTLIDWQRARIRRRSRVLGPPLEQLPGPVDVSAALVYLMEAMDRMTAMQRLVFHAHGIEGRRRKDAAEYLGVSLHTVRRRYAEAIAIVTEVMGLE